MGPPEAVQLGQSWTGMYVYDVFLGRKPVICSIKSDVGCLRVHFGTDGLEHGQHEGAVWHTKALTATVAG